MALVLALASSPSRGEDQSDWAQLFARLDPPPAEIADWSLARINAVARYFDVDRWTHGGDIGMRWYRSTYAKTAEKLNIPAGQLEAADDYVHYARMRQLAKRVVALLEKHPHLRADHYDPIAPTAYCGTYTVHAQMHFLTCRDDPKAIKAAGEVAAELARLLPPEVDGYKITDTTYECLRLQTRGSLEVAFLWRRGSSVRKMKPSGGTYGGTLSVDALHWHQRQWNERKPPRQVKIPP